MYMPFTVEAKPTPTEQTVQMLQELRVPAHRLGYQQLCLIVPYYRENSYLSMTKDLYPWLAKQFDCHTPQAVEHTIRDVIQYAWQHRDPDVWARYFPDTTKPPTNKQFIAALASRIK